MYSVIPCFEGESCWCRIIVSPSGDEMIPYGEFSADECYTIVDALNKECKLLRKNIFKEMKLPWCVHSYEYCGGKRRFVIVSRGFREDDYDSDKYVVGCGVDELIAHLFVDAVNNFYQPNS